MLYGKDKTTSAVLDLSGVAPTIDACNDYLNFLRDVRVDDQLNIVIFMDYPRTLTVMSTMMPGVSKLGSKESVVLKFPVSGSWMNRSLFVPETTEISKRATTNFVNLALTH